VPLPAGATDRHVLIGDRLNHRIVRVDKAFAAETVSGIE